MRRFPLVDLSTVIGRILARLHKGQRAMFGPARKVEEPKHELPANHGDLVLLRSQKNPRVKRWQHKAGQRQLFHESPADLFMREVKRNGGTMAVAKARVEHPKIHHLIAQGLLELEALPASHLAHYKVTLTREGRAYVAALHRTEKKKTEQAQRTLFKGDPMIIIDLRLAAQRGLFSGAKPAAGAKKARHRVKAHVAKNPGGKGVHVVQGHARGTGAKKAKPKPTEPAHTHTTTGPPVTTGGEVETVWVVSDRRRLFDEKVEGLAKRARRLRVDVPSVKWTGATKRQKVYMPETAFNQRQFLGWETLHEAELTSPAVRLPGWQLVAKKEPKTRGAKIHVFDRSAPKIPRKHATGSMHCDHCGANRNRASVFLVHKPGTRTWKQVGGECVKDYTGRDARSMVPLSNMLQAFREDFDDLGSWSGGGRVSGYNTANILALTAWHIAEYGWTSGKDGSIQRVPSTAQEVGGILHQMSRGEIRDLPWAAEKWQKRATTVHNWLKKLPEAEPGSYMENLRVIGGDDYVDKKDLGYLVSAVSAWQRDKETKRKARAAKKRGGGGLLGKPGDKVQPVGKKVTAADRRKGVSYHPPMALRITRTHTMDGVFGTTHFCTFEDHKGNVYEWAASNRTNNVTEIKTPPDADGYSRSQHLIVPLETGQRFIIVGGTVKEHTEYRGEPRTKLTRCKLIPVLNQAEARKETGHMSLAAAKVARAMVADAQKGVKVMRKAIAGRIILVGRVSA